MRPIRGFLPFQVDFSAKVRWRMRFDRNSLFVTLQDKYALREYARLKGVKTAQLLHVTDRPETIPFEGLPPNYLIKANHGCAWNILCFDSELYLFGDGKDVINHDGSLINKHAATKSKLSRSEAVQLCRGWLAQTYSKREWAYQHIRPRIIVEELLIASDNTALKDYRMYTFRGVVKAINVGSAIYRRAYENVFFDPNWKQFKLTKYREQLPEPLPEMPASLGEMIEVAQKLGEGIDFARIDLYDTTRGVVLGEVAIYPEAGGLGSPTSCPVFNKWLGDQWKLTNTDIIKASWWNLPYRVWWYGHCAILIYRGRSSG